MAYEVYDQNGNRMYNYDLRLGHLEPYVYTIEHEAEVDQKEQGHWGTVAVYYNEDGTERGKDVIWIVDAPAVIGHEAYTETGVNYTYIPYTEEELEAARKEAEKPDAEAQIAQLKAELEALETAYLRGVNEM